mmetsp:Transcript_36973/g.118521  ORF Transcript_36973/g.118521 Transcript_36973/m.118521 type:complete len:420 (-) Transcript_36973:220-1479(-)
MHVLGFGKAPSREFQLVIYGATGFTGRLAAKYVARQYGTTSLKWAIAGRSSGKLEAMRGELGDDVATIVADGDDLEALKAMAERTDAIATCAGPFARYGSKLVRACAEAGTGYCDITGESDWVRSMIDDYDDVARKTGARIVHFCGHDSIPWDLCTLMLHKKFLEKGTTLKKVDFYDDIKSSPSGGTLETMFGILFGPESSKKSTKSDDDEESSSSFDPLLRSPEGTKAPSKTKAANVNLLDFGDPPGAESGYAARTFFVMAGVNANAVKRSNALLSYGDVEYREGRAFSSTLGAVASVAGLAVFGAGLAFPPTRWLLRKTVLPQPGEGPSEEDMLAGFLKVKGFGTAADGSQAACTMEFKVDPGYMDTARMVVEAALCLSLDADKLNKVHGGSYPPASCQGEVLLTRLCNTGTTFSFL